MATREPTVAQVRPTLMALKSDGPIVTRLPPMPSYPVLVTSLPVAPLSTVRSTSADSPFVSGAPSPGSSSERWIFFVTSGVGNSTVGASAKSPVAVTIDDASPDGTLGSQLPADRPNSQSTLRACRKSR